MKKIKIVLSLAVAIAMSIGLSGCSSDEPAPEDNPVKEVNEFAAAFGDDYWVVTDTKYVTADGKEYDYENEANICSKQGIPPMLGVYIDGTHLRMFTTAAAKYCYMDFSMLKADGKTMYLNDDRYNYIKLESVDAGRIVLSSWLDKFYIYNNNTEDGKDPEIAKGVYMKSYLRKAIPEEIEKMKEAIYITEAYH